jgi:hypothetical protein
LCPVVMFGIIHFSSKTLLFFLSCCLVYIQYYNIWKLKTWYQVYILSFWPPKHGAFPSLMDWSGQSVHSWWFGAKICKGCRRKPFQSTIPSVVFQVTEKKSVRGCYGVQCWSLYVTDYTGVTVWAVVIYFVHFNLIVQNAMGIAVIFNLEHCACRDVWVCNGRTLSKNPHWNVLELIETISWQEVSVWINSLSFLLLRIFTFMMLGVICK